MTEMTQEEKAKYVELAKKDLDRTLAAAVIDFDRVRELENQLEKCSPEFRVEKGYPYVLELKKMKELAGSGLYYKSNFYAVCNRSIVKPETSEVDLEMGMMTLTYTYKNSQVKDPRITYTNKPKGDGLEEFWTQAQVDLLVRVTLPDVRDLLSGAYQRKRDQESWEFEARGWRFLNASDKDEGKGLVLFKKWYPSVCFVAMAALLISIAVDIKGVL